MARTGSKVYTAQSIMLPQVLIDRFAPTSSRLHMPLDDIIFSLFSSFCLSMRTPIRLIILVKIAGSTLLEKCIVVARITKIHKGGEVVEISLALTTYAVRTCE